MTKKKDWSKDQVLQNYMAILKLNIDENIEAALKELRKQPQEVIIPEGTLGLVHLGREDE